MDKNCDLELARSGRRMPIATHLVLHEKSDPEAILIDGERLAAVMLETAERFGNPLALPIMDLTLEKDILLRIHGALKRGGYLFLGASEALNGLPDLYQMVQCSPGIIYKVK